MTIQDVENLSFAELKARRAELIEAITASTISIKEVAGRYIQARADAKHRDEKLAEQAKTIAALQEGLEAVKEREAAAVEASKELITALKDEVAEFRKTSDAAIVELKQAAKESDAVTEELLRANTAQAELVLELGQRCDRLKVQAEAYADAIGIIYKTSTDAINSRVIAQADEGE